MMKSLLLPGLFGSLLLGGAGIAQDRDPASPVAGNAERGRILLSILGPKPNDTAGVSPLQQQELNRRVRCAATRQEIQDQLDFEAAGSIGFYVMAQLRIMEQQSCTPVGQQPALQQAVLQQPAPQAPATYRPPPQRPAPQPVQQQPQVQQSLPQQPAAVQRQASQQPAPHPPPAQQAPPQPAIQAPSAKDYTPAPDYPHDEMAAGHEGVVLVQLIMNADGSVKAASVAKSSTYPTLDASALTAARTWRIPEAAGKTIEIPLKFSTH